MTSTEKEICPQLNALWKRLVAIFIWSTENKHVDRVESQGRLEVGRAGRFMSEEMRDVVLRGGEYPCSNQDYPWETVNGKGRQPQHPYLPSPFGTQQHWYSASHLLHWHRGWFAVRLWSNQSIFLLSYNHFCLQPVKLQAATTAAISRKNAFMARSEDNVRFRQNSRDKDLPGCHCICRETQHVFRHNLSV